MKSAKGNKYELHENEIKEIDGKIIKFGVGSYYKVGVELLKWFIFNRDVLFR